MNYKKIDYFINLDADEEILYEAQKNTVEFWVSLPFTIFAFCFSAVLLIPAIIGLKLTPIIIFFIFLTTFFLFRTIEYIRDFCLTQTFLTNKSILIRRSKKIITIDYKDIQKITYFESTTSITTPSNISILLDNNKIYKINFIPEESIKAKLEEINPDLKDKNELITPVDSLNCLCSKFCKTQIKEKEEKQETQKNWAIEPKRGYLFKNISIITTISVLIFYWATLIPDQYRSKYFCFALSIVGLLAAIAQLKLFITLKPHLIIKEDGIIYHSIFIPWDNVKNFALLEVGNNIKILTVILNNYEAVINQFPPRKRKNLIKLRKRYGNALIISLLGTNLSKLEALKKLQASLKLARKSQEQEQSVQQP